MAILQLVFLEMRMGLLLQAGRLMGMMLSLLSTSGAVLPSMLLEVRVSMPLPFMRLLTIGCGVPFPWKFRKWHPPVTLPHVPPTVVLILVVVMASPVLSAPLPGLVVAMATPNAFFDGLPPRA